MISADAIPKTNEAPDLRVSPSLPIGALARMKQERGFAGFLLLATVLVVMTAGTPDVARWVGFLIAAYAVVANDSIQTLGTFLSSNRDRPWWQLWLFIASIFVVTACFSWVSYGGDVSYERLAAKGFETAPSSFTMLQVGAPLILLILTRLGIPVSTTFLLLTTFATEVSSVGKVLTKSFMGYGVAFASAIVLFFVVGGMMKRFTSTQAHPLWRPLQWTTTGLLWSVWIMQDAANVAVYLPRALSPLELVAFLSAIVVGLAFMFRRRGEAVQKVVEEKSMVTDVRAATVIDLVYAGVLYYFKIHSKVPMSTTWVFIGLLAGREVALSLRATSTRALPGVARLMAKDLLYVTAGLVISVAVAMLANDGFRREILTLFAG